MSDEAGAPATVPVRAPRPWAGLMAGPLSSFHYLLGVFALITTIGLVMVQTSSSFKSVTDGGTPFSLAMRQLVFVAIGLVAFYLALRMRIETIRRAGPWMIALSIMLLVAVLVPGIGSEVNGARSWIRLGAVSFQPGEFARLSLIIWGAAVVSGRPRAAGLKGLAIPLLPVAGAMCLLLLAEPDQGMTTLIALVVLALLWFGGLSVRTFLAASAGAIGTLLVLALLTGYRNDRLQTYWHVLRRDWDFVDPQDQAYQVHQGLIALADGGLFGNGLGQSSASRGYLPEATNDFIFAVVGEQLGWVGATFVIGLFAMLALVGMRIAARTVDPFLKLLAAVATTSVVLQASINIGYVVGLLPVTGLQLPLISAGGTSTVTTMLLVGVLANAARHEPEAISAIFSGGDSRLARVLRLPAPVPYEPRTELPRPHARTTRPPQRFGPPVRPEGAGPDPARRVGVPSRRRSGATPSRIATYRRRGEPPWREDARQTENRFGGRGPERGGRW